MFPPLCVSYTPRCRVQWHGSRGTRGPLGDDPRGAPLGGRPKARPLQRRGLRCGLVGLVAVWAWHVKDDLGGLGVRLFGDGGEGAE